MLGGLHDEAHARVTKVHITDMNRDQQHATNAAAIERLATLIDPARPGNLPNYAQAVATLNREGLQTSRGYPWTRRSLYRMLQREGFSGIHGLGEALRDK